MKVTDIVTEAAIAVSMKKAGKKPKQGVAEGLDNKVAKHNAAVAKLPGGQAHRSNHPDILHTAPKGYSFSVSHKLVPDEQGVAEGFFGIDDKIKGKIQNIVSRLSDEYGMWDHKAQTFTPDGLEHLKSILKFNDKYIKYALSLTSRDFEAEGVAEEQLEETSPEAIATIEQLTRR